MPSGNSTITVVPTLKKSLTVFGTSTNFRSPILQILALYFIYSGMQKSIYNSLQFNNNIKCKLTMTRPKLIDNSDFTKMLLFIAKFQEGVSSKELVSKFGDRYSTVMKNLGRLRGAGNAYPFVRELSAGPKNRKKFGLNFPGIWKFIYKEYFKKDLQYVNHSFRILNVNLFCYLKYLDASDFTIRTIFHDFIYGYGFGTFENTINIMKFLEKCNLQRDYLRKLEPKNESDDQFLNRLNQENDFLIESYYYFFDNTVNPRVLSSKNIFYPPIQDVNIKQWVELDPAKYRLSPQSESL